MPFDSDPINSSAVNRQLILYRYTEYIKCQLEMGQSLHLLLRPLYGLSSGLPGARKWRQELNKLAQEKTKIKEGLQDLAELITV